MAGLFKVFKNTISLTVLQAVYIITPLVVIPFLVESFGLKGYGVLAYVITVLAMFKVVIDYSFELTATKTMSLYHAYNDSTKLQEKVSLVISTKLALCAALFPLYAIIGFLILSVPISYIFVSYTTLIADIFFINWFFQGLQKSGTLLFFRVISRSAFVVLLVVLLDKEYSVYQYFIFEAISSIVGVILLFFYIKKSKKVNIFNFTFDKQLLWIELKSGFDIFISKVCVTGYGTVNLLFLGGVVSKEVFAIYTIVEKVFNSLKMISSQFGNALIPYLANISSSKAFNDQNSLVKIILINQAFLFASSLGLFLFGDYVVSWISGGVNELHKELIIFFSVSLFLSIGPVFTAILIGQGRECVVRKITIKVMVLNLMLLLPVVYFYGAKGLAVLVLINSIYQFLLQLQSQYLYAKRKDELI